MLVVAVQQQQRHMEEEDAWRLLGLHLGLLFLRGTNIHQVRTWCHHHRITRITTTQGAGESLCTTLSWHQDDPIRHNCQWDILPCHKKDLLAMRHRDDNHHHHHIMHHHLPGTNENGGCRSEKGMYRVGRNALHRYLCVIWDKIQKIRKAMGKKIFSTSCTVHTLKFSQ